LLSFKGGTGICVVCGMQEEVPLSAVPRAAGNRATQRFEVQASSDWKAFLGGHNCGGQAISEITDGLGGGSGEEFAVLSQGFGVGSRIGKEPGKGDPQRLPGAVSGGQDAVRVP